MARRLSCYAGLHYAIIVFRFPNFLGAAGTLAHLRGFRVVGALCKAIPGVDAISWVATDSIEWLGDKGVRMASVEQEPPMDAGMSGGPASSVQPAARAAPGGDQVTAGLQRLFDSIADEPIPDDFLRLLDDIDNSVARLPGGTRQGGAA